MRAVSALDLLFVGVLPPLPGGAAISTGQLLVGLANSGHGVRAVAPITADTLDGGDRFAAAHPRLEVHRFVVPYFEIATYVAPSATYQALERERLTAILAPLLNARTPDVLIIGRESLAWHFPDVIEPRSIPTVLLVRGNPTMGIVNGTYPQEAAEHLLRRYRTADRIVAPARHMTAGLERLGFGNVHTILNAVDLETFRPLGKDTGLLADLGVEPEDIVVMLPANLHPRKRPLDLVAAAASALPRDPRLLVVIVGDGRLREAMEGACGAAGISPRVRFTGWVDYEQMPRYINLADVVVLPSESEGLARVYLEAQACGRVIVASDIPPAREVIVDGETGLLFRMGDVADLATKLLVAADRPDMRLAIGERALERVKAHGLPGAVASYAALLTEVARGGRRR